MVRRLNNNAAFAALPLALSLPIALVASVQAADSTVEVRVQKPANNETITARAFDLDIFYKNQNENVKITAAELWVDSVRWVRRDLDTPDYKGILSFDVETVDLAAGPHNIVVKLFAEDGTVSSAPLTIRMSEAAVVSNATEQGAPELSFRTVTQGKKVSGTVEIGMNVKSSGINGGNPFVSFYVDDKFKTLKNFPPYSFMWDTTTLENGYHTIDAVAYQESSQSTTKRRVGVYVDNVGGATKRVSEVVDLNVKRAQEKQLEMANAPTAKMKGTLQIPTPPVVAMKKAVKTATIAKAAVKPAVMTSVKPAAVATSVKPATIAKAIVAPVKPAPASSLTAIVPAKAAVKSVAVTPKAAIQPVTSATHLVAPSVKPSMQMVAPKLTAPAAIATVVTPLPAKVATTVAAAPKTVTTSTRISAPASMRIARAGKKSAVNKSMTANLLPMTKLGAFDVSFDNSMIVFDVAPRIENGLPLAPFRQIFEHTGGKVEWYAKTRTVRATNTNQEVIIKVGEKTAKVNGEMVELDRASFIERGRTIVPISFVGQALDVNINFDPASGRLQITSK
jgi:hypothetical protein